MGKRTKENHENSSNKYLHKISKHFDCLPFKRKHVKENRSPYVNKKSTEQCKKHKLKKLFQKDLDILQDDVPRSIMRLSVSLLDQTLEDISNLSISCTPPKENKNNIKIYNTSPTNNNTKVMNNTKKKLIKIDNNIETASKRHENSNWNAPLYETLKKLDKQKTYSDTLKMENKSKRKENKTYRENSNCSKNSKAETIIVIQDDSDENRDSGKERSKKKSNKDNVYEKKSRHAELETMIVMDDCDADNRKFKKEDKLRTREIEKWEKSNKHREMEKVILIKSDSEDENYYINKIINSSSSLRRSYVLEPDMNRSIEKYGDNYYAPRREIRSNLRPIYIDGSNIAFGYTSGKYFSVKGLKMCIDYFLKKGHEVKAFVPSFRQLNCSNPVMMQTLIKNNLIVLTPSRHINGKNVTPYDDRYIVKCAAVNKGIIVSCDNYRDLISENRALLPVIEQRLLMPVWVGDMLIFPDDPLGRYGPTLEKFLRF